jgi:hypothetical protein
MSEKNEIFSGIKTQKETFEFFDYTLLEWNNSTEKLNSLLQIYKEKKFFNRKLNKIYFKTYITIRLLKKWFSLNNILATRYKNNKFYIYLDDWTNFDFTLKDIQTIFLNKILNWVKKETIEKEIIDITNAVKAIHKNNKWTFYNDDINDKDIITDDLIKKYNLDKNLKWKNLKQLKQSLDLNKNKIGKVYNITWESNKYIELLKFEVTHYMWTTDEREGSAQYIGMSNKEIQKIVWPLVNKMSYKELFIYLRDLHKNMDDNINHWNYKKSDMAKQVNRKLFDNLYKFSFERLKRENASNKSFIELIKVMSGRWARILTLESEKFEYDKLEWDPIFRDMTMANKIMIYVMQKPWGVIEEIIKIKNWIDKIEVKDKELNWKTPSSIMAEAETVFSKFWKNQWKSWNQLLKDMNFDKLIWIKKPYNELSLEEKIKLGAVARMTKIIENISIEEVKEDPSILHVKLWDTMKESFEWINETLENQFDKDNWFSWNNAKDLWLSWDIAEIYDLYQDINWNLLFDLSDDNWFNNFTWSWTATLAFGIIAAWAAILLLPAWAATLAILWAWALAWAIWWLMSNIFWKQWYDSFNEWALDIIATMSADAVLWAFFFLWSIRFWWSSKIFKDKAVDILTLKITDKKNLFDMALFWWIETFANAILLNPIISAELKNYFIENHFDTDNK